MSERKTNDKFVKDLINLGNGIISLEPYIDSKTKINFQCKHGHIWAAVPSNILSGFGCPYCAGRYKTKETLQQELDLIDSGITVIGWYIDSKTKIQFMCSKGHLFEKIPYSMRKSGKCPYCSNKMVLI